MSAMLAHSAARQARRSPGFVGVLIEDRSASSSSSVSTTKVTTQRASTVTLAARALQRLRAHASSKKHAQIHAHDAPTSTSRHCHERRKVCTAVEGALSGSKATLS